LAKSSIAIPHFFALPALPELQNGLTLPDKDRHLCAQRVDAPSTRHSVPPNISANRCDRLSSKEAIAPDDKPFSLKASSVDRKYGDRTEVYNNKKVV
jgi:hypothetical protein